MKYQKFSMTFLVLVVPFYGVRNENFARGKARDITLLYPVLFLLSFKLEAIRGDFYRSSFVPIVRLIIAR